MLPHQIDFQLLLIVHRNRSIHAFYDEIGVAVFLISTEKF
jgi:hypothetical protein